MIAQIQGTVVSKSDNKIVIMVGGIGVELIATRIASEASILNESVQLSTRLIVREDSLTLFGFGSDYERDIFDVLIKINGVGPKMGVAILSTLSIDNLRQAVASERADVLTRVPGVGKKTAQKILLELKDKLPVELGDAPMGFDDNDVNTDVMDALVALGFSVVEAQSAIQSLPPDTPNDIDERIRLSLQTLSR